jgi:hypothetical protein
LGSRARRRPVRWAAAGTVLAAGCLLTGCTATGADPSVSPAAATAAAPGSSWFLSAGGDGTDHTGTISGPGDDFSVPQPPRPDLSTLNVPYSPVGVAPTLTPKPDDCRGSSQPRRVSPGVTAGAGSATVTWQAVGDSAVTAYRVSAVSQQLVTGTQPAPPQQTVGQAAGCSPMSLTFGGLTSGVPYVFWLEEQTRSTVPTTVQRWVQVGSSAPVVIG